MEGSFDFADADVAIAIETDEGVFSLGCAGPGNAPVIVRTNNWLFLTNDRNRSFEQFTQQFEAKAGWIDGWTHYFKQLSVLTSKNKTTQFAFLVAPSKETIFPDY